MGLQDNGLFPTTNEDPNDQKNKGGSDNQGSKDLDDTGNGTSDNGSSNGNEGDGSSGEDVNVYAKVAEFLKEEGVINIDDPNTITEENFKSIFNKQIEQAVDSIFSKLPREVAYLVEYSINGGDIKEVLPLLASKTEIPSVVTDSNAEPIVTSFYKDRGLSDDEVSVIISKLKEDGKLLEKAQVIAEERKRELEEQEKKRIQELEAQQKEQEERVKQFIENTVKSSSELGLKAEDVYQFLTVPIKSENGVNITMFDQKLQKMYSDPNVFSKFVYWAMNDFSDDIFVKKAKKKVAKDFLSILSNTDKNPKHSQNVNDNRPIWETFK